MNCLWVKYLQPVRCCGSNLNFIFLLLLGMVMSHNEFETMENKI